MTMTYDELVDAVERETAALAQALGDGPDDAQVATCPAWKVRDLATHVGEFTAVWTHVLCEATSTPKTPYEPVPPAAPDAMAAWYGDIARHLVDLLRVAKADTPSWTWVPSQQHAGFIARRCANELAIHRFDAQSARGTCTPV